MVIVHERFTELGGSEQVVGHLASLTANSRVFAPIVDQDRLPPTLNPDRLSSSFLQGMYCRSGRYAHLLPLLPLAMSGADLSDADVVVTSHHAFANRVRVPPEVPIISYTHSPARWMWDPAKRRGESGGPLGALAIGAFAATARRPDRAAANRIDIVVANSRTVARRIRRWWGRSSVVIHPPVDVDFYTPGDGRRQDFFLLAGRLVPYKRAEVAISAANRLGCRLVVAGDGRTRASLEALAGPTVELLGQVSDADLRGLYRSCAALLFPGEEDFGIVPVEAQGCGAPVIAHGAGGATETVIDGGTGHLVPPDRDDPVGALCRAMVSHDPGRYDPAVIRENAEQFSVDLFVDRFDRLLGDCVDGWQSGSRSLDPLRGPEPTDLDQAERLVSPRSRPS
ncbi:MAG: glycosyltransferase family 4 protein [Actinomycetia bacterium]|nr:glycosyltransferase family 4 protein [Actinomycetes bacterium]MCP4225403.1 glycosyltransferase family 4 protein [Actinomycetes bacterium]MCP5030272.1 glycosyltransferase family 4 protein [Actinomycetes bacterium]